MGISLTLTGGRGSLDIGYTPPIVDGLEYWGFMGGNATRTQRNYAPGKPNGVIGGSPTYSTGYASFGRSFGWIDTDVSETDAMSFLYFGRNADNPLSSITFRPFIMGNQECLDAATGARTVYSSLNMGFGGAATLTATSYRYSGGANSGLHSMTVSKANLDKWHFGCTAFGDSFRRLRLPTFEPDIPALTPATTIPRDPGIGKMRIGRSLASLGGGVVTGNWDCCAAVIFSRTISSAEEDTIRASVLAYLESAAPAIVEGVYA